MASYSFHLYFDSVTGNIRSASQFGCNCARNPERYFSLGWWQPTQNHNLPFVSKDDLTINRIVYGKMVEIGKLPESHKPKCWA